MVVLRSGKVLNAEITHRRLLPLPHRRRITTEVPVYGRVMEYRGRQSRATMRRGPDRFHEPTNSIPLTPVSPSMPPLDPPTQRVRFEDEKPGPLPTQVQSRHHRENDPTCDCRDYPTLSLLGYTPLCIHRMIDPLSPRYTAYLPRDYTMHEGERGSDAIPSTPDRATRAISASPASDATTEPDRVLYKEEAEPEFDDSDLEMTAWTDSKRVHRDYKLPPSYMEATPERVTQATTPTGKAYPATPFPAGVA